MITIKYKGVEVTCTTTDEAIEMIKKIDEAKEIKKVTIPQIEPFIPNVWPDCDKCPNKPDLYKPIFGDSPCTWCRKNTPYSHITYTLEKN